MKGNRGFTLLEMLVALTIFGLVTAMLAQNTWGGVWAARQAWTEVAALRLAQSLAVAGDTLAVTGAGGLAKPDRAIDTLSFRLKSEHEARPGSVIYRAEVSSQSGQVLAASTARNPVEGRP